MIDFTVTLHNAVARKCYLIIQSVTFTVDLDSFQMELTVDMHIECICDAESNDIVNIYIKAMHQ